MPPVRVLYVIATLEVGGTETQLVQLLARLDRRKFEPTVCCLSERGPLAEVLQDLGVPVEVIGFRGFCIRRHPRRVLREMRHLLRVVREVRPAIVHGFLFWAYLLGTFAARLARVPLVVTSRRSLGTFKEGIRSYLLLERIANRLTDLVVTNAEAIRQDAIRQEGLDAAKVRVIYNGVDLTRFDSVPPYRPAGLPPGRLVVTVANLNRFKAPGLLVLVDAAARVLDAAPAVRFVLVGDGPCREEVMARVAARGLTDRIHLVGARPDVPAILAACELKVLPSFSEGLPNAVLEAMAAGKPVVATRVGGIPEAVVDGETGLLVAPGDPAALAAAILQVLADPVRAADMGRAGRRRVAASFGLDRMAREVEALYEALLQGDVGVAPVRALRAGERA